MYETCKVSLARFPQIFIGFPTFQCFHPKGTVPCQKKLFGHPRPSWTALPTHVPWQNLANRCLFKDSGTEEWFVTHYESSWLRVSDFGWLLLPLYPFQKGACLSSQIFSLAEPLALSPPQAPQKIGVWPSWWVSPRRRRKGSRRRLAIGQVDRLDVGLPVLEISRSWLWTKRWNNNGTQMPPKQQMHRNGDFGNLELKGGGIASCMEHVCFQDQLRASCYPNQRRRINVQANVKWGSGNYPNAVSRKWDIRSLIAKSCKGTFFLFFVFWFCRFPNIFRLVLVI